MLAIEDECAKEMPRYIGLVKPNVCLACACISTVLLKLVRSWELRRLVVVLVTFLCSH